MRTDTTTAVFGREEAPRRSGRQVGRDIEDACPGGQGGRHRDSANAAISLELANDRAEVGRRGGHVAPTAIYYSRELRTIPAQRRIALAPRGKRRRSPGNF